MAHFSPSFNEVSLPVPTADSYARCNGFLFLSQPDVAGQTWERQGRVILNPGPSFPAFLWIKYTLKEGDEVVASLFYPDMTSTHPCACFSLKTVLDAGDRTVGKKEQTLTSWSLHSSGRTRPCTNTQTSISHMLSAAAAAAKSHQSCPTLCDPRDSSPPGTPVPGILQARTLEWVAISFSNA